MKATSGIGGYMRRSGAPATWALIGAALGIFVISWLMLGKLYEPLSFALDWSRPWGLLTYSFANFGNGMGLFWFLLELYWLFWVGTSTEIDLGRTRYLVFFFASAVVAALFIWLGMVIVHPGATAALGGLELPISALTVAWGTRHKHENILLMAIIPIPGWILAWLTVALVIFGYGSAFAAPLMGAFAALHLGLAYLYAENRIPNFAYGREGGRTPEQNLKRTEKMDRKYYDDVKKREQDRAEREKLRKLFENSMGDDKDK
ncbi:MAG: rhomboid family intramembrane serine protease [Fimbriimonadales bacterium]